MTIQANIEKYEAAKKAVTDHCMCASLERGAGKVIIYYPAGDFAVGGIRVDDSAAGLAQALPIMERHWQESFPGYKAA